MSNSEKLAEFQLSEAIRYAKQGDLIAAVKWLLAYATNMAKNEKSS